MFRGIVAATTLALLLTSMLTLTFSTSAQANTDSATFDQIERYYDARKAVVTITIDDYYGYEDHPVWSNSILPMMKQRNLYFTIGVITDASTGAEWAYLQDNITTNQFVEVGSHSRTHPHIPYRNYGSEINGSKRDIIGNLTLPTWWSMNSSEYVYAWIRPYGSSDSSVQTWLGDSYYLCDRHLTSDFDRFASWDSTNEVYPNVGVSIWITPLSSVSILNNKFNNVYNAGGIYHFATHGDGYQPANWSEGGNVDQHTDHISNRTDVWYVPFGLLYLYHFFQDRNSTLNLISVSESGNGENKVTQFTVNSTYHQRYGMTYPLTYRFGIPPTWTEGYAYYKYRAIDSWTLMPNKTSADFFNGEIASRFDFATDKACISINFSSVSHDIYLMIRSTPIPSRQYGRVWNLNTGQSYPIIQEAINNASVDDRIFVFSGVYYENVVINKTILLIGEDKETTIIDGNQTGDVITVTASNVSVKGFTIRNSTPLGNESLQSGILLNEVNNATISGNVVESNGKGISFIRTLESFVNGNIITNNWYYSVGLYYSNRNIISNNLIYGIYDASYGIMMNYSLYNEIYANTIENCSVGFSISSSHGNIFYHNGFVYNMNQGEYTASGNETNTWDYGYPYGGNYWSNYNGSDLYLGPYQNETGSDGIGDTLYVIDANNTDCYPLMNPWIPPDIAAVNITTSKTIVGQGYPLDVNMTFRNEGSKIEEFNITIYANSIVINSQSFVARSGNSIIYTITWNTSRFSKGNYTIWAYATPIEGETDIIDNTKVADSTVKVGVPGDLNGDNICDLLDLIKVAIKFERFLGDSGYDPNYDINNDNLIDLLDLVKVARHFGTTDP